MSERAVVKGDDGLTRTIPLAQREDPTGFSAHCQPLEGFEDRLTEEVLAVLRNRIDLGSGLVKSSDGDVVQCFSFAKVVLSDNTDGPPGWAVQKMARLFKQLVEEGWIGTGVPLAPVAMRLGDTGESILAGKYRFCLMLYMVPARRLLDECGSGMADKVVPFLNKEFDADAFATEGGMCSADGWSDLAE